MRCPGVSFAEVRPNILIIAGLIFGICIGIVVLIAIAILNTAGDGNDNSTTAFVIGALIGLLGAGLTGLAGLGTTLVTEGSAKNGTGEDLNNKGQ